jgi:NCAIR mutase (PurE)-related protein
MSADLVEGFVCSCCGRDGALAHNVGDLVFCPYCASPSIVVTWGVEGMPS